MRGHGREYARVAMKMPSLLEHLRSTAVNEATAEWIGVKKQIIVVAMGPFIFPMINPEITKKTGEYQTEESCLSLDGVRPCARKEIEVDYLDQDFKPKHGKYNGFTAFGNPA